MSAQTTRASVILNLLSARHARDIAVAECPLAPWGGLRADLWAMRPSWTKPMTTIYEIKVSRADFVRDDKYQLYLPYCNVFSFATAPGVIDPSELPDGVGLLEITKTGTMMRVVRKAVWRPDDHEALARVTKAVLMNRVWRRGGWELAAAATPTRAERIAEWRANIDDGRVVGRLVRGRIQDELAEMRMERDRALDQVKTLDAYRAELESRGLRTDVATWRVSTEISRATRDDLLICLKEAQLSIGRAQDEIERAAKQRATQGEPC